MELGLPHLPQANRKSIEFTTRMSLRETEGEAKREREMRRTIKWEGMRNEKVRKKGRRERKEERTRREGERIRICKLPSKSNSESFKLLEVLT